MEKSILEQYCAMKAEIIDLRKRIEKGEKHLKEMQQRGYQVSDSVKGTKRDGTIGNIRITGFPLPEYEKTQKMIKRRNAKLKILEDDLLEATNQVDDFINAIPESELRTLFRFYYLDDMTWYQVAINMNYLFPKRKNKYTDESCRKKHDRFLQKIK